VAQFSVRAWLADQIGCEADSLTILDAAPDERTILFALDGEPCGQVHVLAAAPGLGQGIVAAWAPDGSANAEIAADREVSW
jgi:hypothetical protein